MLSPGPGNVPERLWKQTVVPDCHFLLSIRPPLCAGGGGGYYETGFVYLLGLHNPARVHEVCGAVMILRRRVAARLVRLFRTVLHSYPPTMLVVFSSACSWVFSLKQCFSKWGFRRMSVNTANNSKYP